VDNFLAKFTRIQNSISANSALPGRSNDMNTTFCILIQKEICLKKFFNSDFVIGAGDLEVTSAVIWALDVASIPPKAVQLNLNGN
jgi:hypothetical protein